MVDEVPRSECTLQSSVQILFAIAIISVQDCRIIPSFVLFRLTHGSILTDICPDTIHARPPNWGKVGVRSSRGNTTAGWSIEQIKDRGKRAYIARHEWRYSQRGKTQQKVIRRNAHKTNENYSDPKLSANYLDNAKHVFHFRGAKKHVWMYVSTCVDTYERSWDSRAEEKGLNVHQYWALLRKCLTISFQGQLESCHGPDTLKQSGKAGPSDQSQLHGHESVGHLLFSPNPANVERIFPPHFNQEGSTSRAQKDAKKSGHWGQTLDRVLRAANTTGRPRHTSLPRDALRHLCQEMHECSHVEGWQTREERGGKRCIRKNDAAVPHLKRGREPGTKVSHPTLSHDLHLPCPSPFATKKTYPPQGDPSSTSKA